MNPVGSASISISTELPTLPSLKPAKLEPVTLFTVPVPTVSDDNMISDVKLAPTGSITSVPAPENTDLAVSDKGSFVRSTNSPWSITVLLPPETS